MSDKTIAKIAALLNKADRTDNEHEADAFLKAAQRLATLEQIDLAKARAHTQNKENTAPEQRSIVIGQRGQKGLRTFVDLFLGIAHANDVRVDIARNATKVYAYGYREDIDVTEALYAHLLAQMATECRRFLASGEHKNETVWREVRAVSPTTGRFEYEYKQVPVPTLAVRLEFQAAFSRRIGIRLAEARREAEAEATGDDDTATSGTALVLADKRDAIASYYDSESTAKGHYRGQRLTTQSLSGRVAGDAAGQRAKFGADTEIARPTTALAR